MLELFIKPGLEKLIKYIDAHDYWLAYGYILAVSVSVFGLGCFVTWLLQRKKLQREIEKISLESKEKAAGILKQLHEKRNTYLNQVILIQLSVKLCIDALVSRDAVLLKKNRDELLDMYFNDTIKSFVEYLELCDIFYNGWQKKINACIEDEVIPFLETTKTLMDTANNAMILDVLSEQKALVKQFSCKPITRFATNNLKFYQLILRYKFNRIFKSIQFD